MTENKQNQPPKHEPITKDEIERVVRLLDKLPKGFLPLPIFEAVAAKVTTPSIELIPYRFVDGKAQVLMTRRAPDDSFWPNEWHAPGTILRATDEENTFKSAFDRILTGELVSQVEPVSEPEYFFVRFDEVKRGRELRQVYGIEVNANDADVEVGQFFDLDNLPEDTIDHHKTMLADFAQALAERQ